MEMILITRSSRTPRRMHLGSLAFAGLVVLGVALAGTGLYSAYRLGAEAAPPGAAEAPAVVAERAMVQQRALVDRAIRDARHDLDALAARLGEMRAHIIRLDALGARLVDMAGLDPAEFEFGRLPARGGPERLVDEPEFQADLVAELEALAAELEDRHAKLRALEDVLIQSRLEERVRPAGRPVESGWISSYFGHRRDPINGRRAFHEGVDFAARRGTDVLAVAPGVVVDAGYRPGYGRMVEIRHGHGYSTRYAHNQENLVRIGDTVERGQPIARVGSSGRSTGTHVHFEVLKGSEPVDPMDYVRAAER